MRGRKVLTRSIAERADYIPVFRISAAQRLNSDFRGQLFLRRNMIRRFFRHDVKIGEHRSWERAVVDGVPQQTKRSEIEIFDDEIRQLATGVLLGILLEELECGQFDARVFRRWISEALGKTSLNDNANHGRGSVPFGLLTLCRPRATSMTCVARDFGGEAGHGGDERND